MAIPGAPVTGVYNQINDEIVSTPAYVANNPQATNINSTPNAGLSIFDNPVNGNTDTGVVHDGDMGKLSK
jgi:hypothetical protein